MTKFKLRKKVSKIDLRIISKPHANLQGMVKTSVKVQTNKTVGGVAHTRYILLYGDGRKDIRKENFVPPRFFEKAGDNQKQKTC